MNVSKRQFKITLQTVFFVSITLLIYKNLFNMIINGFGNILALFSIVLFLFIVIYKKGADLLKLNKLQYISLILILYIIMNFFYSLFFNTPLISINNILISFRQIIIPLVMIFFIFKLDIDKRFLHKILKITFLLYLFSVLEFFLPTSIVETIFQKIHPDILFDNSAYFFWEFTQPIRRLGSLFFEPLTFGVFTAFMIVSLYILKKNKLKKIFYILIGSLALIKSFYIIVFISFLSNKKWKIFVIGITIFILLAESLILMIQISQEELRTIFFTLGSHFNGLISGIFNGFEKPFLGHGLGTSGYLNALYNKSIGVKVEDINIFFNNQYIGIGNESALGIMVYQLGYIFTLVYSIMHILIIKNLIRFENYMLAGLFLGLFVFFALSESYYTLLLYIYPFILYRVIEVEYYRNRRRLIFEQNINN